MQPTGIRHHLRTGQLKGYGRPYRIPVRGLIEYGVTLEDVPALLAEFEREKARENHQRSA